MMNKDKYIKEVDGIKAPAELKGKIAELEARPTKKHTGRVVAIIAACLAFMIIAIPALNTLSLSPDKSYNGSSDKLEMMPESPGESYGSDAENFDEAQNTSIVKPKGDRKIIKTANISINVKSLDDFIKGLSEYVKVSGGYSSDERTQSYDDHRYSELVVNIPSEKLEDFLAKVDTLGTITQKNINSSDVTNSYIDIQSRIKALETEQETLLKILEKAENLSDVIQLQDRLSQVRSELESYKSQLKLLDGQIEFSSVTISATESKRTIKTDDSFMSKVKEKFLESIYGITDFFTEFAISFLGAIPYLLIIAVVTVVVIVIIKKKRNKK